jgi:5'-3' exoribonuclease 1
MGIEKFRKIFHRRPFRESENVKLPDEIDSLFFDANGILHRAKDDTFPVLEESGESARKYSKQGLAKAYLNRVIERIEEEIKKFNPQKNLIIAVDGVANAAKIQQQKTRRFSPKEKEYYSFDGNSLTPGTEIMVKIDKKIRGWLKKNKENLPPNTIYSSHMEPGEGEHKIMDLIRRGNVEGDGAHIIYGSDGDLYILAALSPLKNLYIYRDDGGTIYSIEIFKKAIYEKLSFDGCKKKLLYQDFALLVIFVGNDFVPKFPNLPGTGDTLSDIIFKVYAREKKHLTDRENNIKWKNFASFLGRLNGWNVNGMDTYHYTYTKLEYPTKEVGDYLTILDSDGKKIEWKEGNFDQSRHTSRFDRRGFEEVWYQKQFRPQKNKLYKNAGADGVYYTKKDVFEMCVSYLRVLQWNQYYYTRGYREVSDHFFYPYRITPLLHNLSFYLNSILHRNNERILTQKIYKKRDDFVITYIHQLLSVLPPSSISLIPKEYHPLYRHLKVINPEKYICPFPENTDAAHHVVPLIPPINLTLVEALLKEMEI